MTHFIEVVVSALYPKYDGCIITFVLREAFAVDERDEPLNTAVKACVS